MIHSKIFLWAKHWTRYPFCWVCRNGIDVGPDDPWFFPHGMPAWLQRILRKAPPS